jgi:tetratricopeptide (TPR) repeat protein
MLSINRAERPFLFYLLLSALALRLIYLYELSSNPFFDAPIVDARSFLEQAQHIAAGHILGGDEPFWQPPLYIYFLAFICWLFPTDYFTVIRLLQIALGTFSCALVYGITRHTFDKATARLATAIAALCSTFIYFEGEFLAVPLEIALNLLLVHRLLLALQTDEKHQWVASGLIAGLAALTRPNVLLFAGAFVVWLALHLRKKPGGIRRWFICATLLLTPTALVILPISVRNYIIESDVVLISSNGGINFYIGNSGDYEEKVSIHPGVRWENMAMEPVRAGHLTAAAKSAYFFTRSFTYITTHPLEYIGTLLKKSYLFWSGPELKRNLDVYFSRQYSHLLSILLWDRFISMPFGLIGPLTLLGFILSWQRKDPSIALLRLYAFSYTVSVLLFFSVARYRVPALPIFIIFAAMASLSIYHRLQQKPFAQSIPLLCGFTALLILLNWSAAPSGEDDAQLHFDLGEVYLRKEQYQLAEAYAKRALELEPGYNYARHNLAVAYFYQDQFDHSIKEGLRTLVENPRRPDTHALLGRAFMASGQLRTANTHFRQALEIDPSNGMFHYYYGRLLYKVADYANAVQHLRQAVEWAPEDAWIHYELGRALHGQGSVDAALTAYEQAWALDQIPAAANAVGAVHFVSGRHREARQFFTYTLERDPSNLQALINIDLLDIEQGHISKGLEHLRTLQRQHPASQAVLNALRAVGSRTLPSTTEQ